MIQPFFDEEAYYAVGVEDEISPFCALVSDHAVERKTMLEEGTRKEKVEGPHVSRAMSCGV